MVRTFSVETPAGVELKHGFKTIVTARKWAYSKGNPFGDGRAMIWSVDKERRKHHGMMTYPGMFTKECLWIPSDNPKNIRFIVKKDGSITRKT